MSFDSVEVSSEPRQERRKGTYVTRSDDSSVPGFHIHVVSILGLRRERVRWEGGSGRRRRTGREGGGRAVKEGRQSVVSGIGGFFFLLQKAT